MASEKNTQQEALTQAVEITKANPKPQRKSPLQDVVKKDKRPQPNRTVGENEARPQQKQPNRNGNKKPTQRSRNNPKNNEWTPSGWVMPNTLIAFTEQAACLAASAHRNRWPHLAGSYQELCEAMTSTQQFYTRCIRMGMMGLKYFQSEQAASLKKVVADSASAKPILPAKPVELTPYQTYLKKLGYMDWYYMYSDQGSTLRLGEEKMTALTDMALANGQEWQLAFLAVSLVPQNNMSYPSASLIPTKLRTFELLVAYLHSIVFVESNREYINFDLSNMRFALATIYNDVVFAAMGNDVTDVFVGICNIAKNVLSNNAPAPISAVQRDVLNTLRWSFFSHSKVKAEEPKEAEPRSEA